MKTRLKLVMSGSEVVLDRNSRDLKFATNASHISDTHIDCDKMTRARYSTRPGNHDFNNVEITGDARPTVVVMDDAQVHVSQVTRDSLPNFESMWGVQGASIVLDNVPVDVEQAVRSQIQADDMVTAFRSAEWAHVESGEYEGPENTTEYPDV